MLKNNLKYKIPLIVFLVSSCFVFLYIFFDSYLFRKELQTVDLNTAKSKIYEREHFTNNKLQEANQILFAIRHNTLFENYLKDTNSARSDVEELFSAFITSHQAIMQLRYIDEKGMEKIRFDRIKEKVLKIEKLQDKSSRYYFKDNINKEEKISYSQLDLNIENGKLDVPFNPTYRVVLPIQDEKKFKGILIINFFGEILLKDIFSKPSYDGILIDKDGYILYHYQNSNNWSKYQEKSFKIEQKYLDAIKGKIDENQDFVAKRFDVPFENELYMILQMSEDTKMKQDLLYEKKIFISLAIFLTLVLIGTFILHFILKRFEKQENEIFLLNKKQQIQEKILIQKSKMAAMGEMISNIAHQWRQPLASISMQIISLELKVTKGDISTEFLQSFIEKSMKTIQNLSSTIDDFSNFFNPNKKKENFELQQSIKEALSIVSKDLDDLNIKVIFEDNHLYNYYGHRNELIQVFINIINNAKDAIHSHNIENGEIAIEIAEEKDLYKLTFLDNGGGVPLDIIDRIFEPYFTTKFKARGVGIGLYMSKMIIENSFDGQIHIENKEDGALCTIVLKKMN
jgi:signal transduction histidine kinase